MNKNLLVVTLIIFIFSFQVNAQTHNCGVDQKDGALIKERMLQNRVQFAKDVSKFQQDKKAITYIPVSFHAVSNTSGVGAPSDKKIMDELCGLNTIYFDQDIQFFIYNQINYLINNNIDADATSFASAIQMYNAKVPGTLNVFLGRSINNQAASFYNPTGDYVFLLDLMLTPQAKTTAHEVGHFFTLPHTFNGWEGDDVEALYGGQAVPSTINGTPVERVVRTGGQANCSSAGDGFCDTEADYVSYRENCPYVLTAMDPLGVALDPDETNMMSYALDVCVTGFSAQQKTAMFIDISSRSWITNTPPSTIDLTLAPAITPISPVNSGQLGSILNPTVQLLWTAVTGAAWYRIKIVGPGVNLEEHVWNGNNFYNLSTTGMVDGGTYLWQVTPLNHLSTCATPSNFSIFTATTGATALASNATENMNIYPNPVNNYLNIDFGSSEQENWSYTVFDIAGRELGLSNESVSGKAKIDVSNLANGTYLIQIELGDQLLRRKFSKE